jgi:hypothetical protein
VAVSYGLVDLELRKRSKTHRWSGTVGFLDAQVAILGHVAFLQYFTAAFNGERRDVTLTWNGTFAPEAV